jgi:hypothetical protein
MGIFAASGGQIARAASGLGRCATASGALGGSGVTGRAATIATLVSALADREKLPQCQGISNGTSNTPRQ